MQSYLKDEPRHEHEGFTLDGDVHAITLRSPCSETSLDLTRLPSLDYAIYLVYTVQFHLGGMFCLFDEEEFVQSLHELYSRGQEKARTDRLWYTQCLLVLALGKGFLNVKESPDYTSSSDLFLRAMSCLPDTTVLHEEPVVAMEVLSTIALYFYCLDMKPVAYSYVSLLALPVVSAVDGDRLPDWSGDALGLARRHARQSTIGATWREIRREVS